MPLIPVEPCGQESVARVQVSQPLIWDIMVFKAVSQQESPLLLAFKRCPSVVTGVFFVHFPVVDVFISICGGFL